MLFSIVYCILKIKILQNFSCSIFGILNCQNILWWSIHSESYYFYRKFYEYEEHLPEPVNSKPIIFSSQNIKIYWNIYLDNKSSYCYQIIISSSFFSKKVLLGNVVLTQFLMWELSSHAFPPHYTTDCNHSIP